jgi:hypothetical protein
MKKLLVTIFLSVLAYSNLWAQGCSVCTQTANQLGDKGADGLNNGIIYLALLPITFISVLGIIWYRNNRSAKS